MCKRENIRFSFTIFYVHKFPSPEIFHCRNSLLNRWLLSFLLSMPTQLTHSLTNVQFLNSILRLPESRMEPTPAAFASIQLASLDHWNYSFRHSNTSVRDHCDLLNPPTFSITFFLLFSFSCFTAFDFRVFSKNVCIWRRNPLHGAGDIYSGCGGKRIVLSSHFAPSFFVFVKEEAEKLKFIFR